MTERVLSQNSGIAPYETFFHDFELEAFPFFNYWTIDEDTNNTLELENRDINDMPRFVKVAWNLAPDLVEQKTAFEKLNPPNLMRNSEGALSNGNNQFIVDGVRYSPEQLQPRVFSQIVNALANSDISPGVLQSVVSLPLMASNIAPRPSPYTIDLDAWYLSPTSNGIPVNYLQNSLNNRTNGYFNLPKLLSDGVNPAYADAYYEMFTGNYSVAPSSFITDQATIGAANASYSPISMRASTATSERRQPAPPIQIMYEQSTSTAPRPSSSNTIKVSFIDVGIGSVVSPERVNVAISAVHANTLAATAQVLGNLISYSESGLQNVERKITLKSFDAPTGLPAKEYVGYILEKYEQINGVFLLKEIVGIGDPFTDEYYDTKVKYGAVYRYRIRSIIRWVRPKNVSVQGTDRTISDALATSDPSLNTATTSLTPNYASYFGSEWSKNWATALVIDDTPPNSPDQLEIRPDSRRKQIVISFQIPENIQRDIVKMTLFRRLIDKNGQDIEPWTRISDFSVDRPGYYADKQVEFIPKVRGAEELGFVPVMPYRYVYAATATSVHNGESNLSEQLGARLNSDWEQLGEHPVEFYSSRGVNLYQDHGIFSTIPVKKYKTHVIVTPENSLTSKSAAEIVLMGQERWATRLINGHDYILRLHSLDTGETHDVQFSTQIDQVPAQHVQAPTNVYVPSVNEQYFYDSQTLVSR
jgi:hypothetical protein